MVKQIAEGMAARGHEVIVITLSKKNGVRFHNGIKIYEVKLSNLYWQYDQFWFKNIVKPLWHAIDTYNFVMENRVGEILDLEKPDIVQTHNIQGFSCSVWSAAVKRKIPLCQVLHDHYHLCPKATMFSNGRPCEDQCAICKAFRVKNKKMSGVVDALVGVSHYILNAHTSRGYFKNAKQVVIYNGYNISNTISKHKQDTTFRFGYMGRLHPTKGLDLLVDAFITLNAAGTELLIAGTGDPQYTVSLERRTKGRSVKFLGYTSHENFYPYIDVLIVPSVLNEPFGKIVIEAMSWGKPVIGSRRGGIPEILIDGKTGFLFEPDDPKTLVNAMQAVLHNREEYSHMSLYCLERAKDFAEEKMLDAYENFIVEIAQERGTHWRRLC